MPRAAGFSFSGIVHGTILAWLITGQGDLTEAPALSMYDQQIRPYESRIIWYTPKERVPDVSPGAGKPGPVRARTQHQQTLVAGAKDDPKPAPKIWLPEAPEMPLQKLPALPNALAVAPPRRPVRPFTTPREKRNPPAAPVLPEAPPEATLARPAVNPLTTARERAAPKPFTPPTARPNAAVLALPEAPDVAMQAPHASARLVRGFAPPPPEKRTPSAPALPDALPAAMSATVVNASIGSGAVRVPPKPFTQPPADSRAPAAPVLDEAASAAVSLAAPPVSSGSEATLAIISLNPAEAPRFQKPAVSQDAGFSAGPQVKPQGGAGGRDDSILVVPGLYARGGAHESQPVLIANAALLPRTNLAAGVRRPEADSAAPSAGVPAAVPVRGAPDARLEGRAVYSLAIQMPNVTSYFGSWIVWFAERGPGGAPSGLRAPSPLRKVDPKYIAAAASERVEGTVRLYAVIGKDGRVDSVSVIRHLDDRLDQSASEALSKWLFEPAVRGGVPVEVDAVFEVPFRLAPRTTR